MEKVVNPSLISIGIGFYSPKTFLSFLKRNLTNSDYTDMFFLAKSKEDEKVYFLNKKVLISSSAMEIKKNWHSFVVYEPICEFKKLFIEEVDLLSPIKDPPPLYIAKILREINFPLSKRLDLNTVNVHTIRKFIDHSLFFRIMDIYSDSLETSFTIL